MKADFYKELKNDFSSVYEICKNTPVNENRLDAVCGHLVFSKRQLEKKGRRKEKQTLIYCIDTVCELAKNRNTEILSEFAGIAADVPDIFLGERNIYSFRKEIDSFRGKYGEEYFDEFFEISLVFNKKAPKNALEYFSPDSDEDFKEKHPVLYYVIVFSAVLGMMMPFAIYSLIMINYFGASTPVNFWWLIGFVGCLIMGVGVFNIFAALLNQYLGHWFTALMFGAGGILVALSCVLTFNNTFSAIISQEIHDFWFFASLSMIFPFFNFVMFRSSVKAWMKRTHSVGKKRFGEMRKGVLNFWFYNRIHKEVGLGGVYYLNAAYVVLFFATLALSILFGWLKPMTPVIFGCFCVLAVFSTFSYMFSTFQENITEHGEGIIFFAIDKYSKKPRSVFLDILFPIVYLLVIYALLKTLGEIWGFALPNFKI